MSDSHDLMKPAIIAREILAPLAVHNTISEQAI
jgi:hypothetical protein